MCEKADYDKHKKYVHFYIDKIKLDSKNEDEEYWGIGIENETYMMTEKMEKVGRDFLQNHTKRERYSIDYFLNYKMDEYKKAVSSIKSVEVPYYINGYMFQNMDIYGENKTLYKRNQTK